MKSKRSQQVGDLIQQTLAQLLLREVEDPRLENVTLTSVEISPDLANATVYFTLLDESRVAEALKGFAAASGFFRYSLAHAVQLRITPKLRFVYDESISRGAKISRLIDDALKNSDKNSKE